MKLIPIFSTTKKSHLDLGCFSLRTRKQLLATLELSNLSIAPNSENSKLTLYTKRTVRSIHSAGLRVISSPIAWKSLLIHQCVNSDLAPTDQVLIKLIRTLMRSKTLLSRTTCWVLGWKKCKQNLIHGPLDHMWVHSIGLCSKFVSHYNFGRRF